MEKLKILSKVGRSKVSDDFLDGSKKTINLDDNCIVDVDLSVDYAKLKEVVDDGIKPYKKHDPSMDSSLAPAIHKSFRINRRLAADKGIWHYISVAEVPYFVRHRWEARKSGQIDKRRFLGGLGHNTVARLWWGAEMTVINDNNYKYTDILFKNQDLYEAIHGRAFWQYPPALFGFLNIVGKETGVIARAVAKNFNHMITTIVLESLKIDEIESTLKVLLEKAKN